MGILGVCLDTFLYCKGGLDYEDLYMRIFNIGCCTKT